MPENGPGFCGNLAQFLWSTFYNLHKVLPSDNSQWSGTEHKMFGKSQISQTMIMDISTMLRHQVGQGVFFSLPKVLDRREIYWKQID